MREQASLGLPPPAGSTHWLERIPFGERTLADIADVNGGFMRLALELHALRPGMPVLGLPAHLVPRMARRGWPAHGGPRLPFVLFDLRFRDAAYWQEQVAGAASIRDADPARLADARITRFSRTALTLGWHLAQSDPQAARLALGLDSATVVLLAGVSVGVLDALARRVAPSLAARFCTRERFWWLLGDAIGPVADPACVHRVRLLGLQLQGADAARVQQLYRRPRRSTQT
jgi:hypothetical protein